MNRIFSLCLLLFLLASYASAQDIEWRRNLDQALQAAKQTGRPVLIDFWADWCEPCKAMETQLWNTPQGKTFASKFIFVRLDFDNASSSVRKYHVVSVPTVVFADSWGNFLTKIAGFDGPAPYLYVMKIVPANYKSLDAANETLSKSAKDVESLRSIARFYYDSQAYEFSNAFYDKALGYARTSAERAEIMLSIGWNYLKLKDYNNAQDVFEDCLKQTELVSRDVALFGMVVSSLGQKKRKEAQKALEELIATYPDSPATSQARRLMQNQ